MSVNDYNILIGALIGGFSASLLALAAFLNSRTNSQRATMQQSIIDNATNIELFKKENHEQKLQIERYQGKLDAKEQELEKEQKLNHDMRLELQTVKGQLIEMSVKDKLIETLREEIREMRGQMAIMHQENLALRNEVNILNNKLNIK